MTNQPSLAHEKDAFGRMAMDVATRPMKSIMQSLLLWHSRYRITEREPEHISATCFVFKAVDDNALDDYGQPLRVALKLMKKKVQFLQIGYGHALY